MPRAVESGENGEGPLRELWGMFRFRKVLFAAWCLAVTLALFATARLTVFMLDPGKPEFSLAPDFPESVQHSCPTAYFVAASLLGTTDNLYDPKHYLGEETSAEHRSWARPFDLDPYQYPPQFLLLPRLFMVFSQDYTALRGGMYLFEVLVTLGGLIAVSAWVGGRQGWTLGLMVPLFWLAPAHLLTLQSGNVHVTVLVLTILAMTAIDKEHTVLGAALLAFAVLSKVFSGVLVLFLLAQRRYKAVLWTAGWAFLYTGLTAAVAGLEPLAAFVTYQLPRLLSGEAFSYFQSLYWYPMASLSLPGLLLKLETLGLMHDAARWDRFAGVLFTLCLIAVTLVLAWRSRAEGPAEDAPEDRLKKLQVWLLVLSLGTLQGSFSPLPYAGLASLWLVLSFAPVAGKSRYIKAALLTVGILISLPLPMPALSLPTHVLLFAFSAAAITYLWRETRRLPGSGG